MHLQDHSPSRRRRVVRSLVALAATACAIGACIDNPKPASLLRCRVDEGGIAKVIDVVPVSDPYGVAPVDINGHFRFRAVVIGNADHVEYINVYVYTFDSGSEVLLHQASYLAPVAGPERAGALTGTNHVYAPRLERELQYGCNLLEGNHARHMAVMAMRRIF